MLSYELRTRSRAAGRLLPSLLSPGMWEHSRAVGEPQGWRVLAGGSEGATVIAMTIIILATNVSVPRWWAVPVTPNPHHHSVHNERQDPHLQRRKPRLPEVEPPPCPRPHSE